jgi:hypothetical protein
MYAGIKITGTVGKTYSIQYVNDLAQTNNWIVLTNLILTTPELLWFDLTLPGQPKRFYRVIKP